jgi:serine/threonine protein kinase/alpha-tubulin suppressor-like RCC1 family protein
MTEAAHGGGELAQLAAEYEILGELGRGGAAVVYRARDRSLGRDVAIKVVHPRPLSPDDDAVARLAREARTVAQLQHPNVVTVFAVRRLSGGGLALVMQLVPGRTLKAVVQQDGPVSPDRCQRILRDVAEALAYAHARGVVHRDVKPENIFIDEETGRALLSDFGIARSEEQESMTLTGTAIGTPFYMSPEQIDNTAIDGRSDLYSLGLVAWEMLTGRRPWDGESLYNVIYKQKHEELPPIEALRPGVPPRLQYIIERMLQKRPGARWAGADALLAQLAHTILPGDYGRWQASLRKRVDAYRASEQERLSEAPADEMSGGLLASTMRFVRSAARRSDSPRLQASAGGEVQALADTMTVPRDGVIETLPTPTSRGGEAPHVTDAPRARPKRPSPIAPASWEVTPPRRRTPWAVGAVAVVGLAGAAVAATRADWIRARLAAMRERDAIVGMTAPVSSVQSVAPLPNAADTGTAAAVATGARLAEAGGTDGAALRPGAPPPSVLALGGRHSCAVTVDGGAECWGSNDRGQLGDGSAQRRTTPVHVAAALTFASIGVGTTQSCGVTRTGDVYCWGSDASGQLGDATTVRRTAPVRVAGTGVYRAVTSGDAHSCAVTIEGAMHCWGSNTRGQLGDGSTEMRTVPTVVTPISQRAVQVVAGASHTCALTAEGSAFCWGANDRGQLGAGVVGDRHVPTAVAGALRFAALGSGLQHTCGLAVDGGVWCWGAGGRGQLGTGSRNGATTPQRVRLPVPAVAIALGGQHSCALVAGGEAYCWGANGVGQLGNGEQLDALLPVRVAAGEPLTALAGGAIHTCAATAAGALLCWGGNGEGQLGDASRSNRLAPARVVFAAPKAAAAPPARR